MNTVKIVKRGNVNELWINGERVADNIVDYDFRINSQGKPTLTFLAPMAVDVDSLAFETIPDEPEKTEEAEETEEVPKVEAEPVQ